MQVITQPTSQGSVWSSRGDIGKRLRTVSSTQQTPRNIITSCCYYSKRKACGQSNVDIFMLFPPLKSGSVKLQCASESLRGLVSTWITGPRPSVSDSGVWGGAWELTFLISSPGLLLPHFEKHCSKFILFRKQFWYLSTISSCHPFVLYYFMFAYILFKFCYIHSLPHSHFGLQAL